MLILNYPRGEFPTTEREVKENNLEMKRGHFFQVKLGSESNFERRLMIS